MSRSIHTKQLPDEIAFTFSGIDVWDKCLIICVEVEIGGLVLDDDRFAVIGLETVGHASIIDTEDDFVVAFIVAFEEQGQLLVDFWNLGLFV